MAAASCRIGRVRLEQARRWQVKRKAGKAWRRGGVVRARDRRYHAGKEIVMIQLTEQQQRQLREEGWPTRVVNPSTHENFVLLPAEMFERVRTWLEAEDEIGAVEEMAPLAGEALNTGEASSRESA
jgi:hypothetical protein